VNTVQDSIEPGFAGHIGRTVADSSPWWPEQPERGERPNVVVILLDDVGFAQLGCYGSSIRTPAIDALAAGGLRYSNFHVAALCSPTRASLLSGRNHHSVGMGFLAAFDTGFPNYRADISPTAALFPELLRDAGYGSYACGKWHLAPPSQMSPAGPFRSWPTQRGFDRYYGFMWGEDDQYAPELWYDQHRVEVPDRPDYHVSEDLVDRSQQFLSDHLTARPQDPFLLYLAFGACHAPHQAPAEYIDAYRGAFDHGWDVERERILQRQIESGIVPPGTDLAPHNLGVAAWNSLTDDQRRLYARMQEAFAGFLTHTDVQIARLVEFLERQCVLDNTMIMLISDNGASGEGGEHGTANEYRWFLQLPDPLEDTLAAYDDLGTRRAHNHYPTGWAQAGNTPFKYYKRHAYAGGVRAPLIAHWPAGITPDPVPRRQFHHVIDIAPTLLDLCGVTAPASYRGVAQQPMHGTVGPTFAAREFRVRAHLDDRGSDEEGVLLCWGRQAAGFSLFVQDDALVLDFNLAGDHTIVTTPEGLPTGPVTLELLITRADDAPPGPTEAAARATLTANGQTLAVAALPQLVPRGMGTLSTQCGLNSPSPISARYRAPFRYQGTLRDVVIDLEPTDTPPTHSDWLAALATQ
jgi:arylsulfatase